MPTTPVAPATEPAEASGLSRQLLERRAAVLAFIRQSVPDPEAAEDVLQDSLLKALRAAPALRDEGRLVPWFYQIVRNAIHDHFRRQGRAAEALGRYAQEQDPPLSQADEAALCACFEKLLPDLKPEYAEVIQRLDLGAEPTEQVAAHLGITRENLKVRRMRARRQLRERLEETCRTCAAHGCLDCTCGT